MGKFDEKVKTVLGAVAFTILCRAATEDKIDEQKMKDISQQLDPKVEGRHRKRIKEKGGQSDNAGMREVLSDWYEVGGLSQLNSDQALGKIASILESSEVDLCPIASELRGLIGADGGDQVDVPAIDKVAHEDSRNSEFIPLDGSLHTTCVPGKYTNFYFKIEVSVKQILSIYSTVICY